MAGPGASGEARSVESPRGQARSPIPPSALDETGRLRAILVFPPSLGEAVSSLPVLSALRKAHPNAQIGIAVDEGLAPLFEGHPSLSRVHVVRRGRGWWSRMLAGRELRSELRSEGYRASVDLDGTTASARLAARSGARVRIGFAAPEGRELSSWYYTVRIVPSPRLSHVSERRLSLLVPLGVKREEPSFVFPDLSDALSKLPQDMRDGSRRAVLHVGAGWQSKLWPLEHFAALARRVTSELSLDVVITWSGDLERARADAVAREAPKAQVAPGMGVRELAAFIKGSRLCVGADTGPVQLAWALGTPTVMLFGPTKVARTGPRSPRARAKSAGLGCAGCMRRRCPDGTDACMRGIRPDEVFELVKEAIS